MMVADEPQSVVSLATSLGVPMAAVRQAIERLVADYDGENGGARRGFELREVGGGWRVYVRPEHDDAVREFVLTQNPTRLSQAALETLAVIAYKQPISRGAVASIRAVNVDSVVRTLLGRGLITEAFTDSETGAIHYETTDISADTTRDQFDRRATPYLSAARRWSRRFFNGGSLMSNTTERDAPNPEGERLQKVMAAAGVASRRVSEDLIAQGRVTVNGEIVTEPGRRVLATDRVTVDGTAIQLDTTKRYVMLNKPVGVVSSMQDEAGRPDLREFTRDYDERLFNVGRLDAGTSGLLVLTNDGELAHVLAHPSFGVSKTYIAKVSGSVSAQTVSKLTKGIELDDGPIHADKARVLGAASGGASMVEITSALRPQPHRAQDARRRRSSSAGAGAAPVRATPPRVTPGGTHP